jgi:predicted PolB exonuclease-like 3'-5' exonuclease
MKLFFDIETVPTDRALQENGLLEAEMKPDAPDLIKRLSLSAATAKILCIGYAIEPPLDSSVNVLHGEERLILQDFWRLSVDCQLFIGHNVLEFDLRFIWQRSIVHQIKPPIDIPFARNRNEPVYDTMQEWSKWGREHISLDALARALGEPSPKESLDGSRVYPYYRDGRLMDICEYCKRDVESVRQVYRWLTFAKGPVEV